MYIMCVFYMHSVKSAHDIYVVKNFRIYEIITTYIISFDELYIYS